MCVVQTQKDTNLGIKQTRSREQKIEFAQQNIAKNQVTSNPLKCVKINRGWRQANFCAENWDIV